jgi:hypothetical protein
LDDYCPRERRVTNHAVVAMIEDDVKQTRCTTCDAEHAYKGGREPRRKKKDSTSVLYREVLAGMTEGEGSASSHAAADAPIPAPPAVVDDTPPAAADTTEAYAADEAVAADEDEPALEREEPPAPVEEGPIHRRLIRATLPRPEGQKLERQEPDFTIRNNGSFRDRSRMRGHGGNGTGQHGNQNRGGRRFAGGGSGMPGNRGSGRPGFGGGAPGGQKRSGRNRRRPR